MAEKRELSLQVQSLGRAGGTRLRQQNGSHESLTAHPLLSSSPSAAAISEPKNTTNEAVVQRYVPYTPRHRPTTTAQPTTSTSSQAPTSIFGVQPGATPQLQLQNLKAAVQAISLSTASVGWAICEKLCTEGDKQEWDDIWKALIQQRATLLLPTDTFTNADPVTPDFVRDHVVYCTAPSNRVIPVVTLSGLRGTISNNNLIFRSSLSTTSNAFQSLIVSTSRTSTLASLPPLPTPLVAPLNPEYPTFGVSGPSATLPFPPHPLHRHQPRPASTPLLGPLASLFGGARSSPAVTPSPLPGSSPLEDPERQAHSVDVSVYPIHGRIVRNTVVKDISKALTAEIKECLTGLPNWIIDKTLAFTASLYPFAKPTPPPVKRTSGKALIVPDLTNPLTASDSFQEFYASIEDQLREHAHRASFDDRAADAPHVNEDERIKQVVERVERAVCALFYDQLFRPSTSDDASHDEALSSRIAALNMLDLGLEHLGIDIGKAGSAVQKVVAATGQTLQQLQDPGCRAPVDKAAVLVATHNTTVKGLAALPPIRLRPEDEPIDTEQTPLPSPFTEKGVAPQSLLLPDTPLPALSEETSHGALPLAPGSGEPSSLTNVSGSGSTPAPVPTHSAPVETHATSVTAVSPVQSPSSRTPVASDVLLPFIIFSIVKSNPTELVSHLLYVQRYRMRSAAGGEEGFCLINLLAAVEFLENVDLAALGLGDSARVMSVADLAPLPLAHSPFGGGVDGVTAAGLSTAARLRGRVEQQVGELTDTANKVISGVFDSSFGALRGLIGVAAHGDPTIPATPSADPVQQQAPWNYHRAGFGLLKRGSGFSITSVASSLPVLQRQISIPSRKPNPDETGQMLVEVTSRPGSIGREGEGSATDASDQDETDEGESDEEEDANALGGKADTRSIRSFGSMMSGEGSKKARKDASGYGGPMMERKSLSDRLANVSVLSRLGGRESATPSIHAPSPPSRRISLLGANNPINASQPDSPLSGPPIRIAPPLIRFLECDEADLRLSEVGELLREYRRVVEGMRAIGGFEE